MNNKLNDYIERVCNSNCFSHAYLIEVDNSYDSSIVLNFAQKIIYHINSKKNENVDLTLYTSVESENIKIIQPDGKFIKKEQLLELMSEFKTKSLNSNVRIYILEYAENLNNSSANTILKFLEEPEDGIIAILVTKNKSNVIDTIVSRCQFLNIASKFDSNYDADLYEYSIDLLKLLMNKKEKAIAYLSELYSLKSDQIRKILMNLSIFYEKVINRQYNIGNLEQNAEYSLNELINNITIEEALERLKKIENSIKMLDYNVNPRIALDILFYKEDMYEGCI